MPLKAGINVVKTAPADVKKTNAIAGVNVVKTAPADVKKINVIVAKITALAVAKRVNLVPVMTNVNVNQKNANAKKVAKLSKHSALLKIYLWKYPLLCLKRGYFL